MLIYKIVVGNHCILEEIFGWFISKLIRKDFTIDRDLSSEGYTGMLLIWVVVFLTVFMSILFGVSIGVSTVYLINTSSIFPAINYSPTDHLFRFIIGLWILLFIIYFLFQINRLMEGRAKLEEVFMGSAKKLFFLVILSWGAVLAIIFF